MSAIDTSAILRWLTEGAPADLAALTDELVARLDAAGVPLARSRIGLGRQHPEIAATSAMWQRGKPTELESVTHAFLGAMRDRIKTGDSPIALVMFGDLDELHVPIDAAAVARHAQLAELHAQGLTDYYIGSLVGPTGHRMFASYASDAPGGFTDEQIAALRTLRPLLALRAEIFASHASTRGLLEVYLGKNAARRVLDGAFLRGTGEELRAVIWFCDLRGFTTLVDRSVVTDVVPALDAHFERVARPVTDAGGEILKFIGDAVLAVFPAADAPADACRRALDASTAALDAVAAAGELRIGVALHLGDVMYGNVGASDRLDFTVIGRAVNEVCRVESLCKETAPLLATGAFVRAHGGAGMISVGKHPLRGVSEPAELFTLERYRPPR